MSPDGNTSPNSEPLLFDVAESSTSSDAPHHAQCRGCGQPIRDTYYEVNGSIVCASCRAGLGRPRGTRLRRVLKATSLGTLAAIGGSLLYFAVAAITGREFGLVAIAVGFMVGTAVRKGSGGRGGWAYQTLAIALTYLAIVSTYVPLVVKEFQKAGSKSSARAHVAPPVPMDTITISARGPASAKPSADSSAATRPAENATVMQAGTPRPAARADATHLGPGTVLLGIGALVLLAAIVPIAAGFSNLIGLLIIGIAVFEAWKLNRRVRLVIAGPYRVGVGPSGAIG
jgi:hypothetical protein